VQGGAKQRLVANRIWNFATSHDAKAIQVDLKDYKHCNNTIFGCSEMQFKSEKYTPVQE